MGRSAHLSAGRGVDAGQVRENRARDAGRTVLEAVVALSIVAITATAWAHTAGVAVRADDRIEQREQALDLAVAALETLRVHESTPLGTAGAGGETTVDGFAILTDPSGPVHASTHESADATYTISRFVLDPGSQRWRRLVVFVRWTERGEDLEVRLDAAIPVLPPPEVT